MRQPVDAKVMARIVEDLTQGILPAMTDTYKVDFRLSVTKKAVQLDISPCDGCLLLPQSPDREVEWAPQNIVQEQFFAMKTDLGFYLNSDIIGKYHISARVHNTKKVRDLTHLKITFSQSYNTIQTHCADATVFLDRKAAFLSEAAQFGLSPSLFGKTLRPKGQTRSLEDFRLIGLYPNENNRKYVFYIQQTATLSRLITSTDYIQSSAILD